MSERKHIGCVYVCVCERVSVTRARKPVPQAVSESLRESFERAGVRAINQSDRKVLMSQWRFIVLVSDNGILGGLHAFKRGHKRPNKTKRDCTERA